METHATKPSGFFGFFLQQKMKPVRDQPSSSVRYEFLYAIFPAILEIPDSRNTAENAYRNSFLDPGTVGLLIFLGDLYAEEKAEIRTLYPSDIIWRKLRRTDRYHSRPKSRHPSCERTLVGAWCPADKNTYGDTGTEIETIL